MDTELIKFHCWVNARATTPTIAPKSTSRQNTVRLIFEGRGIRPHHIRTRRPFRYHGDMQERYAVFCDESYDLATDVFSIAGLFGSDDHWSTVESAWLKTTGGRIFHATDCESDRGGFSGTEHSENLKLYKDLTTVLVNSKLYGFGVALDVAARKEFFPSVARGSDYYKCFLEVLIRVGEIASIAIPQGKVRFTFDSRRETNYTARKFYRSFMQQKDCHLISYFHADVEFTSRESPRIQAADLWARETLKCVPRLIERSDRPARKSAKALGSTGRFEINIFTRGYFQDYRSKLPAVAQITGLDANDYKRWLTEKRLTDTWATRIDYMDSRDSESANIEDRASNRTV